LGNLELAAIRMGAGDAVGVTPGELATVRILHEAIGEREVLTQIAGATQSWIGKTPLSADRRFDHAFGR
jgi:hypothetical protein